MPNTLPPTGMDAYAAYPVHPTGHGKAGYSKGDDLPASVDSKPSSPLHSPSDVRSRSPHRSKDPFCQPESRSASREPGRAEQLQKEAALRQARAAQDASYEADLERAIRRSKRDAKSESRERSGSRSRGLSRIRAAIKEIVSDPFWHRASKEEGEHQDEAMRRIILDEVNAAKASTEAGSRDREARSKSRARSHARSPLSTSQPASRSQSRVRSVVDVLAGAGGANSPYDRKPAAAGPSSSAPAASAASKDNIEVTPAAATGAPVLAPAVPTVEPVAATPEREAIAQ